MANNPYVNKVELANGTTLIDLSTDTAVAADVAQGKYFHLATGERVQGTASSGTDCPTFTITINSSWTAVTSVTCDKTYSECVAFYEDGNSLAVFHIVDNGYEYDVGAGLTDSISGGLRYAAASSEVAWLLVDFSSNGTITGTLDPIPFRDSTDLTASTLTVTAPAGYYESNATKTLTDQYLLAENIKKGISIFGVTGTYEGGGGTTWETLYNGTKSPQDWGDDLYYIQIANFFVDNNPILNGDKYRVTWRNTAYECVAQEELDYFGAGEAWVIGNATLGGGTTGNNEPFFAMQWGNELIFATTDNGGSFTLVIEKQVSGGGGSTLITKTITANGTYDAEDDDADGYSEVTVALPSGTAGTPTATKGTVSNHSVSVTPSVTNTGGVISSGTLTGTPVTVSASELVSGSETKTSNGTYNVANLAEIVVNVSGGSGIGTLLNTTSIGTVNTTSTQASSLNVSCEVSGINSYDLLIVESSVNTKTNGRHAATVGLIFLTGSSSVGTKNGATVATVKLNTKLSSNGTATSVAGTTAYGIYPNSCSVSDGTATIPMYRRYNSTSTGTINGTYTARVYGVNLYDMIGG